MRKTLVFFLILFLTVSFLAGLMPSYAPEKAGANQHTFFDGPSFTSVASLVFNLSDWTFKTECLGETVVLRPYAVVAGNWYLLRGLSDVNVVAVANVENRTSHYKFGLNVSAPTVIKSSLSVFGWTVETESKVAVDEYYGYSLMLDRFGIDFSDLVDAGFSVTVNGTHVEVSGLAGKELVFDPTVFSTTSISSIQTCPLDQHTFVIAYADDTANDVSFQVYDTNGTQVLAETDVDTDVGDVLVHSVSAAAFNSTFFVVAWFDVTDQDTTFAICDTSGNVANVTDADAAVSGTSFSVDVSCLNSTAFVITWFDYADQDCTFAVYDSNGTNLIAATDVDTTVGIASYVAYVSCFNSTHFVIGYHDDADNDATFATYSIASGSATQIISVDVDEAVGESIRTVDVACFNSTHFALFYLSSTAQDASYAVYDSSGNSVVAVSDVDDTAGANCRTSTTTLNSTHFVMQWYDTVDFDLDIAVHTSANQSVVGMTDVETWGTSLQVPHLYGSVCGHEAATDIGLYEPSDDGGSCWVYAYANTTSEAIFRTYWPNGTAWDGAIPSQGQNLEFECNQTLLLYPYSSLGIELAFSTGQTVTLFGQGTGNSWLLNTVSQSIMLMSSVSTGKEQGFTTNSLLWLYPYNMLGTEHAFLQSQTLRLLDYTVRGVEHGFTQAQTLLLVPYSSMNRAVNVVASELLTLYASSSLAKELAFTANGLVTLYDNMNLALELSMIAFENLQTVLLSTTNTVGLEHAFAPNGFMQLYEYSIGGKEIHLVAYELMQTLNLFADQAIGKELAWTLSNTVNLYSSIVTVLPTLEATLDMVLALALFAIILAITLPIAFYALSCHGRREHTI